MNPIPEYNSRIEDCWKGWGFVMYDKKIAYLHYMKNGGLMGNAGHVKIMLRGSTMSMEIYVRDMQMLPGGYYQLEGLGESTFADKVHMERGHAVYKKRLEADKSGQEPFPHGVRIEIGENEYLEAVWQSGKKQGEVQAAEEEEDTQGQDTVRDTWWAKGKANAEWKVGQENLWKAVEYRGENTEERAAGSDTERSIERAVGRDTERSIERVVRRDSERDRGGAAGKDIEGAAERGRERDAEGGAERDRERNTEGNTEKNSKESKINWGNQNVQNGKLSEMLTFSVPVEVYEDKWKELCKKFDVVHPFGNREEYLSIAPKDFIIFPEKYQNLVNNSFLLHGYYNYQHIILGKKEEGGKNIYYLGVPGVYYEREKMVAIMFGFEGFECGDKKANNGGFGYYMRRVEL